MEDHIHQAQVNEGREHQRQGLHGTGRTVGRAGRQTDDQDERRKVDEAHVDDGHGNLDEGRRIVAGVPPNAVEQISDDLGDRENAEQHGHFGQFQGVRQGLTEGPLKQDTSQKGHQESQQRNRAE